jgi:hypothetical protein
VDILHILEPISVLGQSVEDQHLQGDDGEHQH